MPEQSFSAFAAMRALRDELRARLEENEDYRAWKALDEAVRQLEPPTMPRAVDLALIGASNDAKLTVLQNVVDSAANEIRTASRSEVSRADDSTLNFRGRA
jgi:hypothetical protein